MASTLSRVCKGIPIMSVVAVTPKFGIGMGGKLPWHYVNILIPRDMAHFKHITSSTVDSNKMNAIVTGRYTWESIPESFRPLSNRINIIVSTQMSNNDIKGCDYTYIVPTFQDAIQLLSNDATLKDLVETIVVIGGAKLFEESMLHPWFTKCHVTEVDTDFECDTFLTDRTIQHLQGNMIATGSSDVIEENGVRYR